METKKIITKSALATQRLGEKIGKSLCGGEVLALYGDLGSGKTTFVQGFAKGLGIKKRILSPTFVFVRQYEISPPRSPFGHTFYHIDLYRIEKIEDTRGLGLEEIFNDKNAIVAIEWAEKIEKILPRKRMDVFFKYKNENRREIRFNTLK